MSRAISIAGARAATGLARRVRVRPAKLLGAPCYAQCPAQLRGAGAAGLWVWECAMIVRVCARGQANGSADGFQCRRIPFSIQPRTSMFGSDFWKREIKIAEIEIKNSGVRSSLLMT